MKAALHWKWAWLRVLPLCLGLLAAGAVFADQNDSWWWPRQKLPGTVVRIVSPPPKPETNAAARMLIQSLAGLAAQAVEEGCGDELVWVDTANPSMDEWFARLRAAHPELKETRAANPWSLVDGYAKQGIIKGYILYRLDASRGDSGQWRPGIDCSVNVATSLAGVLGGILVAEELEEEAKAHGLQRLLDARGKSQAWCFQNYQDRFNRRLLCTQDPKKPHVRDFAIAHRVFTLYGSEPVTTAAMQWLEPLSPILGWNCGDEFANTDLSSRYGHIQTATDWCLNLPVLMAGAERAGPPRLKPADPAAIDWSDRRSAVSFIESDGDNVQWLTGNFFFGETGYWTNPERGKIPFGWSGCFAHLTQVCPQAIGYALDTRSPNDSFVEWGGGYYYPDHFGAGRSNRWELLAQHARRTWQLMKQTNSRIIGFNVSRHDSADARKAYEIIAGQTDGLLAMLVFQYDAYEAGGGQTFWVKDRNGMEVPVITARYSIWEHLNQRARAGTPAKVAREIRQTVAKTAPDKRPRYDWVIAHAWSFFKPAPGDDENAENLAQENASSHGGKCGYSPVVWCAERLPSTIRVVTPEELAWRIRMEHDPEQTRRFMAKFK